MFSTTSPRAALSISALCCSLLLGCQPPEDAPVADEKTVAPITADTALAQEKASQLFWQNGQKSLSEASTEAKTLRDRANLFLNSSTEEQLIALREQWHLAHNSYAAAGNYIALGQSNPGLFSDLHTLNFNIDASNIQPGYLDAFDIYSQSGIVNDIAIPITAKAVRAQHGFSDDSDVSIGFHALAYLIFGEDGQRPLAQLLADNTLNAEQMSSGLKSNDLSNNRRRRLLKLLCELLLDDIQQLQNDWQLNSGTLYGNYLALPADSRLQLIQSNSELFLQTTKNSFSDSQVDEEIRHNRFAGGDKAHTLAALTGLQKSMSDDILAQLYSTDEALAWQQQVQQAIDSLATQ